MKKKKTIESSFAQLATTVSGHLQRFVMWLRRIIKAVFKLHDIEDLTVGGHCGVCGRWMPNDIFDKRNKWGLCEDCKTT